MVEQPFTRGLVFGRDGSWEIVDFKTGKSDSGGYKKGTSARARANTRDHCVR